MSIASKLTQIAGVKDDIKDAIEAKGVDMTGVAFTGYAAKIGDISGGITPTGNINITTTSQVDVTNYATAQVVDANLVAGNIKDGTTILGVTGSYTGGGGGNDWIFDVKAGTVTDASSHQYDLTCPSAGAYMFKGATTLTKACTFPALTMTSAQDSNSTRPGMYEYMFSSSYITAPPALPATTVAKGAYKNMFDGCGQFLQAQGAGAIGAVTANDGAFTEMFRGSNLRVVPTFSNLTTCNNFLRTFQNSSVLTGADLSSWEYSTVNYPSVMAMYQNCRNITTTPGVFPTIIKKTGTSTEVTLECSYVYGNCTGLVSTPPFPKSRLLGAFSGCTSLVSVNDSTISKCEDFTNTFQGCTSLTSFTYPSGGILSSSWNMERAVFAETFSGCISLATVDLLNLGPCTNPDFMMSSFYGTFSNCSGLRTIRMHPDTMALIMHPDSIAREQFYNYLNDATTVQLGDRKINGNSMEPWRLGYPNYDNAPEKVVYWILSNLSLNPTGEVNEIDWQSTVDEWNTVDTNVVDNNGRCAAAKAAAEAAGWTMWGLNIYQS